MKSGDTVRRDTLRFLLAAVQKESVDRLQATIDRLTEEGKDEAARRAYVDEHRPSDLKDKDVEDVIQKQAKMRRDSIDAFKKGGRRELVDREQAQLDVLADYLPQQLDEAAIRAIALRVVAETGAAGPRDMGKVMPKVLAETKDRADGRQVAGIVTALMKEKSGA